MVGEAAFQAGLALWDRRLSQFSLIDAMPLGESNEYGALLEDRLYLSRNLVDESC
jgi:hypothetical protein